MQIKITTQTPAAFQHVFERTMNLACVASQFGHIPDDLERSDPPKRGRYWWREENKINLCSAANDYFAFMSNETETSATIRFFRRYSHNGEFEHALCLLVRSVFPDSIEIM